MHLLITYLLLQAILQKSSATMMSEEYSLCAAAKHQQVQIACFSVDKDQSVCKMYTLIAQGDFRVMTGQTHRKAALEVKSVFDIAVCAQTAATWLLDPCA